jgi:hypothetical protein
MKQWALLVCLVGVPATVLTQATITGTVIDSSGSAIPGVEVEVLQPMTILTPRVFRITAAINF